MTDDDADTFAQMLASEATVSTILQSKAQALTPIHWAMAAQSLSIWVDHLHMVAAVFYAQMNAATDTAGAQAAVETFAKNMQEAAGQRSLDLRTAIGEHVPDRDDHHRQKIFLAVTTSTSKQ